MAEHDALRLAGAAAREQQHGFVVIAAAPGQAARCASITHHGMTATNARQRPIFFLERRQQLRRGAER